MNTTESSTNCCASPKGRCRRVCGHLYNDWLDLGKGGALPYRHRFFRGDLVHEMVCVACGSAGEPALRSLCEECCDALAMIDGRRKPNIYPEIIDKDVGLHAEIYPLALEADVQCVVPGGEDGIWYAVTSDWWVTKFASHSPHFVPVADLTGAIPQDGPVGILADRTGSLLVVFEKFASKAVVLDARQGNVLMSLDRGSYHTKHCNYPLAFFERNGRTLLVHATAWNRLDVSDPFTGEMLTERPSPIYEEGNRPEHYLDYFHSGLAVSPSGRWITSNGWVWGPWASVRCWNLSRWLDENVWESEDGPSLMELCGADSWDRPLCWVNENTVAWWGAGEDEVPMTSAILVCDIAKEQAKVILPGPGSTPPDERWGSPGTTFLTTGTMTFDRWLFAWKPGCGLSAWDLEDGSRVLHRPDICPEAYHRDKHEFLCRDEKGWSVLRLVGDFEGGGPILPSIRDGELQPRIGTK